MRLVPAAVGACCALWVAFTSWLPAIPAFQHDWSWPFTGGQALQEAGYALHIFHPLGLGITSNAPNGALVGFILFRIAALIGPLGALRFFDLAFVAVAALGTYRFVRSYDAGANAIVSAGIYCASPVFYNKLFAGHTYYLVGIALLPWIAFCACEALKRHRPLTTYALACGVLAAIAAGQFQFMAISAIAVAAVVLSYPAALLRKFVVAALALGAALLLHVADYGVMLQPQSGSGFASQAATLQWQVSQSVPLVSALAQYDYIGGYARTALGSWGGLLEHVCVLAIVIAALLALTARRRGAVLGLVLVILGWFATAGTYGPLAAPLAYAFAHSGFVTAFRELYNFAILTTLGTALLAAQAAQLRSKWARATGAIVASILAMAFATPFVLRAPATAMAVAPQEHARDMAAQLQNIRGRVLLLPGSPALALRGAPYHGVDSDGQPWQDAAPVSYTMAPDQTAYLFRGAPSSQLLARLGIAELIQRSDVRDAYFEYLDPYSASIARKVRSAAAAGVSFNEPQPVDADFTRVLPAEHVVAGPPLWSAVNLLPTGEHLVSDAPAAIVPSAPAVDIGVDPMHQWTQSTRWLPAIPQLACLAQPSLFRLDGTAVMPGCDWREGEFQGRTCLMDQAGALQAISLACIYPAARANTNEPAVRIAAQVAHNAARIAYIRTAFDSRWQLRCGSDLVAGMPVVVDAYAMGWKLDRATKCSKTLTATFAGDNAFRITLLGSWITVALLLAAASFYERRLRLLRNE